MRLYFAYGSNMSRVRLEARVGVVDVLGWSTLGGYRHAFNKRGADGTAKGNIVRAHGEVVHGVLYRLAPEQLRVLEGFEGGYRPIEREVLLHAATRALASVTFEALAPIPEPATAASPTDEYLTHYEVGMHEHGLPQAYRSRILREAGRAGGLR